MSRPLPRIALWLLLSGIALLFLAPLGWMVKTAFQPSELIYANPPVLWGWTPTLENFQEAWALIPFSRYFMNSVLVAALTVPGVVLISAMAGFGFAAFPARGRTVLFFLLLASMALPSQATLLPTFLLFVQLRWVNTYVPLILLQWTACGVYVFLFRQFFRRLPRDLYDCAELDGCTPFQLFWYIALPLARPVMITVALFAFIASWNDYLNPLLYLTKSDNFTLPLGLAFFQNQYVTQLQYMMPMALLSLLPLLALYGIAQRYLIEGVETGGGGAVG
jgi:multiple sugar transport system permease protein